MVPVWRRTCANGSPPSNPEQATGVIVEQPVVRVPVTGDGTVPVRGLLQLLASVLLLSSAWPLTKIALAAGSTPLWFAEGRAVLSTLTVGVLLALPGRL